MRMTRETPIPQTERGRGREYVSVGLGFNLRLIFDCCHSIYRIDIEREREKSHQFFISNFLCLVRYFMRIILI